jgi:hypothetical protein
MGVAKRSMVMSVFWTVYDVMYSFVVCANGVRDMRCFWVRCNELCFFLRQGFDPSPALPKGKREPIAEERFVFPNVQI